MSTTFEPVIVAKIQDRLDRIELELKGTRSDFENCILARSLSVFFIAASLDQLGRYMDLYNEVGGEGWLELAYGELRLIDILSSSWV